MPFNRTAAAAAFLCFTSRALKHTPLVHYNWRRALLDLPYYRFHLFSLATGAESIKRRLPHISPCIDRETTKHCSRIISPLVQAETTYKCLDQEIGGVQLECGWRFIDLGSRWEERFESVHWLSRVSFSLRAGEEASSSPKNTRH